jgi:hypothetical protein
MTVLACIAAVLLAAPAEAHAVPVAATGTVVQTSFTVTGARTADGVTFFTFAETDTLAGTFSGASVLAGECVQRTSGPILCRARETFTGTVSGIAGTVTFNDLITIDPTTGAFSGRFVIVGASGGLANLHGQGTFQGQGTTGTYAATIIFG